MYRLQVFYFKFEQEHKQIINFEQEFAHLELLTTSSFQIFCSPFFLSSNFWALNCEKYTDEINQLQPHLHLIVRIEGETLNIYEMFIKHSVCVLTLLKVGLLPSRKVVFICFNKGPFILEIFTFLCWLFGYVEKRFYKKAKINFRIYDVTDWTANKYIIAKYLKR